MSANFDREYRLAAGKAGGMGFEIGEKSKSQPVPLHINFSIERTDLETQNTGRVTVWNLNKEHLATLDEKDCVLSLKAGYFASCVTNGADSKRVAYLSGSAAIWWLRSPDTNDTRNVWNVRSDGNFNGNYASDSLGIRPALVLPSTLLVSDDGTVSTNTPPTITSTSGASGVNLGSKTAAFSFKYTPNDADGDKLTVTEKLDGVVKKTRTNVTSGTQLTFECASTAAEFQKILNGTHTITIEVSDGKASATFTATFTKAVHKATITLKTPLAVSGDITAAVMSVVGQIPAGAVYKVEATNNAKDTSPVWQDVTAEAKSGANIVFKNKTAVNGAAFNFRITVERGTSAGGYISGVSGAFQ